MANMLLGQLQLQLQTWACGLCLLRLGSAMRQPVWGLEGRRKKKKCVFKRPLYEGYIPYIGTCDYSAACLPVSTVAGICSDHHRAGILRIGKNARLNHS